MKQIIECVPNFSEGRNNKVIQKLANEIKSIEGVSLLNVDPGKATNRSVFTFVGEPEKVIDAAFLAIKLASEIIDMRNHKGEHPRMGSTDVCPLIPIQNISMKEVIYYSNKLAKKVGNELNIPVYLYENSAKIHKRSNLAYVRSGEYEALKSKLLNDEWKPDYGPTDFKLIERYGATAICARDFLIAYNINLNTTSTRRANAVAFDIREKGRLKRKNNLLTGEILKDKNGNNIWTPGTLKGVKAIGWYIKEYGICQVTMNITDLKSAPLHQAFDETEKKAMKRGLRVTGSELIGLVPKKVLIDAGLYFIKKQKRSTGIPEKEIIKIAIKTLGLNEISEFNPDKRIIEYLINNESKNKLINLSLKDFTDETSTDSPTPGGGSVSAYIGALGASLATMVANLSAHKRGWDEKWEEFSIYATKGEELKNKLINLVDRDTESFNNILSSYKLPENSDDEIKYKQELIIQNTKNAILIPFEIMELSYESFEIIKKMAMIGNPNSISDAGVAALCARSAVIGAYLNVKINCYDLKDINFKVNILKKSAEIVQKTIKKEKKILDIVNKLI
tara:strand:- start:838 stop:2526 length:1689 start_codon:yes stop_codon:yes gene_type:complete